MFKCKLFLLLLFLLAPVFSNAAELPITLFPIENYNQNVDAWLNPAAADFKISLLSPAIQKQYAQDFYNHLYATNKDGLSPWSKTYVEQYVAQLGDLQALVKNLLAGFNNAAAKPENIIYGENFRPYDAKWFAAIAANLNLAQFHKPFKFSSANRAIVVRNTFARILPTREVGLYSYQRAGEGYPFDNFQTSALWIGTPVYILGQTTDRSWSLIVAASFIGWVESDALAQVSPTFIQTWQKHAQKNLLAITQTETPIVNKDRVFQQMTYVGTVLPVLVKTAASWEVLLPYRDSNGTARVRYGYIQNTNAHLLPLPITRENFALLFKTLQGRPYGWGGEYFYNDCSQELRSLYTPFGIWLPRNTADQALAKEGRMEDKSALSLEQRLQYLMQNGKPLMTFVNVGGHVFLYVGNYPNPKDPQHDSMIMTYQDMWGLKSSVGNKSSREVVGGTVFFPLLASYPEDANIKPQAGREIFQVVFLGEGVRK